MDISLEFQEFSLSLGVKEIKMGKRLTPEEKEARIKAYEEAKAARQAARFEKRKERIRLLEERKAKREREKRGIRPKDSGENTKTGYVKNLPPFKGKLNVGDEVGFRFLGMAIPGKIVDHRVEEHYRDIDTEGNARKTEIYMIKAEDGTFYPIRKNDILCKKVNGVWKEKA